MCATAIVNAGTWQAVMCESQGEWRAAIGRLTYLPDAPEGTKGHDDHCLCWVDIEADGKAAGYAVAHDGMDYLLTRVAPA